MSGHEEPTRKSSRDAPDLLHDAEDRRLWKKFQSLRHLPEKDQRVIVRMLDTMTKANHSGGRKNPAA